MDNRYYVVRCYLPGDDSHLFYLCEVVFLDPIEACEFASSLKKEDSKRFLSLNTREYGEAYIVRNAFEEPVYGFLKED